MAPKPRRSSKLWPTIATVAAAIGGIVAFIANVGQIRSSFSDWIRRGRSVTVEREPSKDGSAALAGEVPGFVVTDSAEIIRGASPVENLLLQKWEEDAVIDGWKSTAVLYRVDFDRHVQWEDDVTSAPPGTIDTVRVDGRMVLRVEQSSSDGWTKAKFRPPATKLRDKDCMLAVRLRTQEVQSGPVWTDGVKVALRYEVGTVEVWQVVNGLADDKDWHLRFATRDNSDGAGPVDEAERRGDPAEVFHINRNAKRFELLLGLERASGRVWFDEVTLLEVVPID